MRKLFRPQIQALIVSMLTLVPAAGQTVSDFFDDQHLHDVWLMPEPVDWKTLKANFMENTYYKGDFQWNGSVVKNVGIRSRGSGSRSGVKPGLQVDFARYDKAQTFLGLKSIVLRNMTQDIPMMAERLSMLVFRRMGLAAPREAHARLYINGEYAGLYLAVEEIDAGFVSERFGPAIGYLYEYKWAEPYFFGYRGSEASRYCPAPFKPVTNTSQPEAEMLEALFRAINLSSDADFPATVSRYLDLKLFVKHLAVDTFVTEMDGLLSPEGATNFYLYRSPATTRFQFLTWDKNATFIDAEHPIFWNVETNVLARRALAVAELRQTYLDTLVQCAETAGGYGGWLEQEAVRAYNQIRAAAREDQLKPYTNDEFEEGFTTLLHVVRERSGSTLRQVEQHRTP